MENVEACQRLVLVQFAVRKEECDLFVKTQKKEKEIVNSIRIENERHTLSICTVASSMYTADVPL